MNKQDTFKVSLKKEGIKYIATVDDLEHTSTWAKSLKELDFNIREAIALVKDLPEGAEDNLQIQWDLSSGNKELDGVGELDVSTK